MIGKASFQKNGAFLFASSGLAVLLSFSFFSAPVALSFGHYVQTASPLLIFRLAAAMAAILIVWHARSYGWRRPQPTTLFAFCIGVWSVVTAPFHDSPHLTLSGSLQIGDGAVFWFGLSLIIHATHCVIDRYGLAAKHVIALALVIGLTIETARHLWARPVWKPFFIPDVAGWSALACAALAAHLAAAYDDFFSKKLAVAISILAASAAVLSENYASLLLTIALSTAALIMIMPMKLKLSIFLCSAVSIFLLFIFAYFYSDNIYEYLNLKFAFTLSSRFEMAIIQIQAAVENGFQQLFFGSGWGSNEDLLHRDFVSAPSSSLYDKDSFSPVALEGNAFYVSFHSHNIFSETLYSIGISGVIILFLFFIFSFSTQKSRWLATLTFLSFFPFLNSGI